MVTLTAPGLAEMRAQYALAMIGSVGVDTSGPSFRTALLGQHIETIIIGGVRGGKTTCGDAKIKADADWHAFLGDTKERLYWVVAAQYELCHQEMEYFHRWAELDGTCRIRQWNHPGDGQWTLIYDQVTSGKHLQRVIIESKSGEKDEGLSSVAPDGVLVAEAGQCPPAIRSRVLERASEKGAFIVYQGTLEDDEAKPRYSWYVEESQAALDDPSQSVGAYSLPSWENKAIYGDCRKQLAANPLYAEWCPDTRHGPEHSELNHPVMRRLLSILPRDEFRRRYGGEPVGLQFSVYKNLDELVLPCPQERMIGAYGGIDYGCFPMNTEILTKEGFKFYEELSIGELVAGYSIEARRIVWTPLIEKVLKGPQPVIKMQSRSFQFVCTPDHAWVHERWPSKEQSRRELHDIPVGSKGRILVTAPCDDEGEIECTPAEAAVLGWLVTDGAVQGMPWAETGKSTATIAQKTRVDDLLRDLNESGLAYTEQAPRSWGVRMFHLSSPPLRRFLQRMEYQGKESLPYIATRLSPDARRRMLDAMLAAEGHIQPNSWLFTQNEGPVWESFCLLATLCGYRLNPYEHEAGTGFKSDKTCYRTTLARRQYLWKPEVTDVGVEDVWCPVVGPTFVVARQGNQITITGNTVHPTALVACTMQYDPLDQNAPKDQPQGIMWVREVRFNDSADPGDTVWLARNKRELSERWGVRHWGVDPNERFMARSQNAERGQIVEAVRIDDGSRGMRIAATKTRLSLGKLKFDESGQGVRELVEEMKDVHLYKTKTGEMKLKRERDDRTAALEDAVEIADGQRSFSIPKPMGIRYGSGRRSRSYGKQRRV